MSKRCVADCDSCCQPPLLKFTATSIVDAGRTHPVFVVLSNLNDPGKPIPDAKQIQQDAWGGLPEFWEALVDILGESVKTSILQLQDLDNIMRADINTWTLLRTYALWSSTAVLVDGPDGPGEAVREAVQLGNIISLKFGGIAALRYVSFVLRGICNENIQQGRDTTKRAWEATKALLAVVVKSVANSIVAIRHDVSLFRSSLFVLCWT